MNLHDIVPTEKRIPKFKPTQVRAAIKTADQVIQLNAIRERGDLSREDSRSLGVIIDKLGESFTTQRRDIADSAGALPEALWVTTGDPLTQFARSPRVALSSLRDLADAFGFVILPWGYFTGTGKATSAVMQSIDAFVDEAELDDRFIPYVLCPVTYYNLERHVAADDDLPIYPGSFGHAFMGINMSIPMFRQLARRVGTLEAKAQNTSIRLDSVETELANLARRLGEIQRAEERRQREAAIAREQAREAAALASKLAAVRQFIPYDPMLIAIPSDKDIHSDAIAVVGPCWGPDFDDVVAVSRGYKRIPGQRKMISRIGW
jgi:hypothetical protein